MTYAQFLHWQSFSIRMAKYCYPKATKRRREKILEEVRSYFYWRRFQKDWCEIMDWDGNGDEYYLGDQVDDFFSEHEHWNRKEEIYTGRFHTQITCCIRAGFDIAVKQSGGVLGFDAGDIRRMWKGVVPDWVKEGWETPFDSIPDAEPVWL